MNNSIYERLTPILRRICDQKVQISASTRLYHDLRITGDDAVELFESVHKEFGTRFDGLIFANFFPDETEGASEWFARLLRMKDMRQEMTVGHLIDVIEREKWFEP